MSQPPTATPKTRTTTPRTRFIQHLHHRVLDVASPLQAPQRSRRGADPWGYSPISLSAFPERADAEPDRAPGRKENHHNKAKKPERQLPGAAPVASWVEEARRLPRVVGH